jgi:hypothetical protein
MQAWSIFGDVKMKNNRFFWAGWIATTTKDPETILETIWDKARLDFTGLIGFSDGDKDRLKFTGIDIVKDHSPEIKNGQYKIKFEVNDVTKMQPEFLELWDYLVAFKLLDGKLSAAERKMILASIQYTTANKITKNKIEITKRDNPKEEKTELIYPKKQTLSIQAMEILEDGYEKSGESIDNFCKKTIGFLAYKLSDNPERVLWVFDKESKKLKYEYKDEALTDMPIYDFVRRNPENLEVWIRKNKKKNSKKKVKK